MEIVKPSLEYWKQEDITEHISKCAAICYRTLKFNSARMVFHLAKNGHTSMFRHGTRYFIVLGNTSAYDKLCEFNEVNILFGDNPYIHYHKTKSAFFISVNENYILDNPQFYDVFMEYEVTPDDFEKLCPNKNIIRFTFVITTSIKVSREFNRVSPNNIAEQSTRYVNFLSKCGDVAICESVDYHLQEGDREIIKDYLEEATSNYKTLINAGILPEDARRVLPLDTATRCAYTYTLGEWKHILNLRYHEKTGKAAPDAKVIGNLIYNKLVELGYGPELN